MRFGDLKLGDVFEAFGETFFRQPTATMGDLPEANAINVNTGKAAFFGKTVPVDPVSPDSSRAQNPRARNVRTR